jgi:hypothetical protein
MSSDQEPGPEEEEEIPKYQVEDILAKVSSSVAAVSYLPDLT